MARGRLRPCLAASNRSTERASRNFSLDSQDWADYARGGYRLRGFFFYRYISLPYIHLSLFNFLCLYFFYLYSSSYFFFIRLVPFFYIFCSFLFFLFFFSSFFYYCCSCSSILVEHVPFIDGSEPFRERHSVVDLRVTSSSLRALWSTLFYSFGLVISNLIAGSTSFLHVSLTYCKSHKSLEDYG